MWKTKKIYLRKFLNALFVEIEIILMTTLALWRCPQYSICQDKNEYHYHSVNCDKTLFLYFLDIKIYCDLVLQALHLNFFMVRWTIVWPNWTPYVGCQCEKILLAHITFIFNVFHFNAIEVRFSFLEIWVKKLQEVLKGLNP